MRPTSEPRDELVRRLTECVKPAARDILQNKPNEVERHLEAINAFDKAITQAGDDEERVT